MLVLFETAAGYALFKVLEESRFSVHEDLLMDTEESHESAASLVKLKNFVQFDDTTTALAAANASLEGKISKPLKKLLKKLVSSDLQEELLIADAKLGQAIKEKYEITCISTSPVQKLMRLIRSQMESLIDLPEKEVSAMRIGLAHSLSRYKLKFSPDKVDTMIVQAISLLDDLDKEINNYIMRCREWYGWHFPELSKLIEDNVIYCKVVNLIGIRTDAVHCKLDQLVDPDLAQRIAEAAETSIGTEISEEDILNIRHLAEQVEQISDYRAKLNDYLKNRMNAIAPNLTVLVGEAVGARLIARSGSLINLAKHPASTVQILGAEKALFRALKTRHDTPKYGLIYHASLVGKCGPRLKGKISRMLAAKSSLAARVDALGDGTDLEMGVIHRANLEERLEKLEEFALRQISGTGKRIAAQERFATNQGKFDHYDESKDFTIAVKRQKPSEE